jgi:hypothetical protein
MVLTHSIQISFLKNRSLFSKLVWATIVTVAGCYHNIDWIYLSKTERAQYAFLIQNLDLALLTLDMRKHFEKNNTASITYLNIDTYCRLIFAKYCVFYFFVGYFITMILYHVVCYFHRRSCPYTWEWNSGDKNHLMCLFMMKSML